MIPGPAPVMMANPSLARRRDTSWATAYQGSLGPVRAEPKTVTALVTPARRSKPSMNSPVMRMSRQVSVRVKSSGRATPWDRLSSFSSSVTGVRYGSRMASSMGRSAGSRRAPRGRPASRCPISVRSRTPSTACRPAWARTSGPIFLPPAVRGTPLRGMAEGPRRDDELMRSVYATAQRRAAATQASTSSSLRGIREDRWRYPVSVTMTSSSMRTPKPRSGRYTPGSTVKIAPTGKGRS